MGVSINNMAKGMIFDSVINSYTQLAIADDNSPLHVEHNTHILHIHLPLHILLTSPNTRYYPKCYDKDIELGLPNGGPSRIVGIKVFGVGLI